MKRASCLIIAGGLGLSVTSCVITEDALNYDPGSYAPGISYTGNSQDAYREGYRMGRRDSMEGLSRMYTRHENLYDYATKSQFREGYLKAYENYSRPTGSIPGGSASGPLRASVGQGQITFTRDGRTVSTIRTAMPNIETWHYTSGQRQVVTKSRGNHGPATVELFDVQTGTLRGKVLAFAIQHGEPAWARGMQD